MKKLLLLSIMPVLAWTQDPGSFYLETHKALQYIAKLDVEMTDGYNEILIIQYEKEQFLDEQEDEEEEESDEDWWARQPEYTEDLE